MNQILSVNMQPKGKKVKNKDAKPVDTKLVMRVFAICLLILGIAIIAVAAYTIFKNLTSEESATLQPSITIEDKSEDTILLKVVSNKNISKLEYRWNDGESTVENGTNGKYIEKEIKVPAGTSTLYVTITDTNGEEYPYQKQYNRDSNIKLDVSGNKIKITYNGDKEISYMTYKWDDQDEQTIQINDTKINKEIDAIKGLHTLTVTVVDEDNNTDTKVQKINGVSKPEVKVRLDDAQTHFVITATDDEQIKTIEFKLNQDDNQDYIIHLDQNGNSLKEIEYTVPMELQAGRNTIEVTITNSQGITTDSGVYSYEK